MLGEAKPRTGSEAGFRGDGLYARRTEGPGLSRGELGRHEEKNVFLIIRSNDNIFSGFRIPEAGRATDSHLRKFQ